VINWKEETPNDFIFSAKFPRKITHIKKLQDCKEELEVFIEHISLLEINSDHCCFSSPGISSLRVLSS